ILWARHPQRALHHHPVALPFLGPRRCAMGRQAGPAHAAAHPGVAAALIRFTLAAMDHRPPPVVSTAAPVRPPPAERSARQQQVVAALLKVLPRADLLWQDETLAPYECDGLSAYRERPLVVALPRTPDAVAAVLRACHELKVPVVARGGGTGLSGGALPHALGVTLSLARLNQIVHMDPLARTATVQCGVRNLAISEAAARHGLYYAPDPSSQIACTIGGNVAENAGGVHCLKYGLTVHNV